MALYTAAIDALVLSASEFITSELPDVALTTSFLDGCEDVVRAAGEDAPDVFVGSGTSDCSIPAALAATRGGLPYIAAGIATEQLSDKDTYPTTFRLATPTGFHAEVVAEALEALGVPCVAIVYDAANQANVEVAQGVLSLLPAKLIEVKLFLPISNVTSMSALMDEIVAAGSPYVFVSTSVVHLCTCALVHLCTCALCFVLCCDVDVDVL